MRRLPINQILLYICLFSVLINIYLLISVTNASGLNQSAKKENKRLQLEKSTSASKGSLASKPGYGLPGSEAHDSLYKLAKKKNIWIGTAIKFTPFISDRKYRQILYRDFNMVTLEQSMKFLYIHPKPDQYNFSESDLLVDFATDNHLQVRGHPLVWGELIPDWVTKENYSKDEIKQILKDHIQTIVSHYKGRVVAWDVVNEAFNEDGTYRKNFWYRTLGPEYIELAFRWAHEADPDALLFYNDYNNEGLNAKSDRIYQMLSDFKQRGVPIHGVGFQMHTSIEENPDQEAIAINMKRLADIQMQVHITELDVEIKKDKLPLKKELNKQAKIFGDTLKTCLSASNCKAFVMWGFADHLSWKKEHSPLIFDANYNPKPAYHALIDILSK